MSPSILATMSAAFTERVFRCGFSMSRSVATSDAIPVAGPTFFFAFSTAASACSISFVVSSILCFAMVKHLSRRLASSSSSCLSRKG